MAVIVTRDIETPLGKMRMGAYDGALVFSLWLTGEPEKVERVIARTVARCGAEAIVQGKSPLIDEAEVQIMEYLGDRRTIFTLPIRLHGTDFQRHVWQMLADIKYGCATTYGVLAIMARCEGGSRAVGSAVGANPLHVIIPCHRVIEKSGRIGGYAGGEAVKFELLACEGRVMSGDVLPRPASRDSSPKPSRR